MNDIVDKVTRSRMMASIKGRDTRPEMLVRRFLHAAGFRYRLHCRNLPGKPDLVLRKYNLVIFVHGCFWHRHKGCHYAYMPSSNSEKWKRKLEGNRKRDEIQKQELLDSGWRVLVIWECGLKHSESILDEVVSVIKSETRYTELPETPPRTTSLKC